MCEQYDNMTERMLHMCERSIAFVNRSGVIGSIRYLLGSDRKRIRIESNMHRTV